MIRPAKNEDMQWVVHTWLAAFADSDAAMLVTPRDPEHTRRCDVCGQHRILRGAEGRAHPGNEYWRGHRRLVELLLTRSAVTIAEADDGLLDGFMVHTLSDGVPVVHFLYVRLSARERGVAKALVSTLGPAQRILYTHRPRGLKAARLPKQFVYDHYQLYWSLAA